MVVLLVLLVIVLCILDQLNQEELSRAIGALKASHERSLERVVNEEKEQWRNETDDLLRTTLESAREEWKTAKAKELEKSLAFWRNTWDVEKDRAIQEALHTEQQTWETSVAGRIEARLLSAQQEWASQATKEHDEARRAMEVAQAGVLEGHLAKHQAELSAVSAAYEVARALQAETDSALSSMEQVRRCCSVLATFFRPVQRQID